jgi:hypothetical protein
MECRRLHEVAATPKESRGASGQGYMSALDCLDMEITVNQE